MRLANGTSGKQASQEGFFDAMASASDGRRSGTVWPSGSVQFSQATLPPSSGSSPKSKPWAETETTSAMRGTTLTCCPGTGSRLRSGAGRGGRVRLDPASPLADHHPDHDESDNVEHGQAHKQRLIADRGRQRADRQREQGSTQIARHAAEPGRRGDVLLWKHVRHDSV